MREGGPIPEPMPDGEQFDCACRAAAGLVTALYRRGIDDAIAAEALIHIGLTGFIASHGNRATAEALAEAIRALHRRPRVHVGDMETRGHA